MSQPPESRNTVRFILKTICEMFITLFGEFINVVIGFSYLAMACVVFYFAWRWFGYAGIVITLVPVIAAGLPVIKLMNRIEPRHRR